MNSNSQELPSVSPVPNEEVSNDTSQKSFHLNRLLLILGVIVLVIILGGVYLYLPSYFETKKQNSLQLKSNKLNETNVATSGAISSDLTSYTSDRSKILVEYPPEWTKKTEISNVNNFENITLSPTSSTTKFILIRTAINDGRHPSTPWIPNTKLVIDGISCDGVKNNFQQGFPTLEFECIVAERRYAFIFFTNEESDIQMFTDIISRTKFIEKESSLNLDGWQIYENKEFPYSIEFPSDWIKEEKTGYRNSHSVYLKKNGATIVSLTIQNEILKEKSCEQFITVQLKNRSVEACDLKTYGLFYQLFIQYPKPTIGKTLVIATYTSKDVSTNLLEKIYPAISID